MTPIEKFLDTYRSKRTKQTYSSHLNVYFQFLKVKPETYFTKKRDYIEDVTKWLEYNQKCAPLTRASRMNCIRSFLEDNDVIIPKKKWKQYQRKQKANKPITLDRIPTNQELKEILSHSDAKARALILVASSSGMRISEILKLEPDDIDLKSELPKVYVRYAKFEKPRICFISNEAKNSLIEWYKVRDKFLKAAVSKCNTRKNPIAYKNADDKRIFPINYQTFCNIWHRILRDAGLNEKDKSTGFHRLHIHTLRKFYKTRLLNAGMQEAQIRKLMGQSDSLGDSYDRFTEEDLKNSYKTHVKSLSVFEKTPDLTEHNHRITQLEKENEQLRNDMQHLMAKVLSQDDEKQK